MYSWISEGSISKYHRAVKQLKAENKEASEEAVKELYVKMGGLLVEKAEVAEIEEVVEAPRRRGRLLRPCPRTASRTGRCTTG